MKKICALLIISLSIFFIYFFNKDDKIYYLILGDYENEYYKEIEKKLEKHNNLEKINTIFLKDSFNPSILYRQIKTNIKKENQTIKNALIKADLVTIYLNYDKLINSEFSKIDKESKKIDKLFKELRKNCKETIVVVGPNDDYNGSLKYLNKIFRNIANKYEIIYVKEKENSDLTEVIMNKININA